ncbi:MAG: hypothetical protein ACRD11_14225, partial [Terriglobia bacterium]
DGTIRKAELHWYEAHGVGKKELKIKRFVEQKYEQARVAQTCRGLACLRCSEARARDLIGEQSVKAADIPTAGMSAPPALRD